MSTINYHPNLASFPFLLIAVRGYLPSNPETRERLFDFGSEQVIILRFSSGLFAGFYGFIQTIRVYTYLDLGPTGPRQFPEKSPKCPKYGHGHSRKLPAGSRKLRDYFLPVRTFPDFQD